VGSVVYWCSGVEDLKKMQLKREDSRSFQELMSGFCSSSKK
jgi:hypothetical protein